MGPFKYNSIRVYNVHLRFLEREPGSCVKFLQKLASKSADNDTFVPECDRDGKFKQKQCDSTTCSCVNPDTGAKEMGSSVSKRTPLICTMRSTCAIPYKNRYDHAQRTLLCRHMSSCALSTILCRWLRRRSEQLWLVLMST